MAKRLILWPAVLLRGKGQDLPLSLSYSVESLALTLNWEGLFLQHVFPALVILSSFLALTRKALFKHRANKRTRGQALQSKTNAKPIRTGKHLNFPAGLCKLFIPSSPRTLRSGHSQFKLGATGSHWNWLSTECVGSSLRRSLRCLRLGTQGCMSQLVGSVLSDFPSFPPQLRSSAQLSLEWGAFLSGKLQPHK